MEDRKPQPNDGPDFLQRPKTPDLVYIVQKALNEEASMYDPPSSIYQPSGSQLLDHVHHRIARLVILALKAEGMLPDVP